jgi:hypothetical protein
MAADRQHDARRQQAKRYNDSVRGFGPYPPKFLKGSP